MQDFKLVGREMNLCMSSIKNFAELEAHLLIKVREGSELYIQYFLNHLSETLKSKTEPPMTKFYALFLLFRASELQNYSFYYLLGKSDQVTNVVFHYSQLDSSSTVPANKKGVHIFSKNPTYQEAMIGANFWRLCQELVIYWYETTKSYKPRESFEVFQYIYVCTKKKCQLPKLYHFLEKEFDLNQEIATCDFSIKSPYVIKYQEEKAVIEELPISPELNEEPLKSASGSQSSLSLDEDIIVIPTNARNRHRTSTVMEQSVYLSFSREAAAAVVTANSQTEIGSGPPKLSAAVRRSIFASKKNLSLPAHDAYSPKESWGGRGEPDFLISNDDNNEREVLHSPLSKVLSSVEGTPTMSRYSGLLKEDAINLKGGNDESKTDGSEVKSIGSRRKMSMEEELAEIQNSITNSLKANSLNPSLTNLKSGSEPKSAVGFHKLFDEEHTAKVRRASINELGGSTDEMATPKPQMRKSKFSILIHSEQKSDGGSGGQEATPSVQNASVTSSPGKNYYFKRQSNLEVVARVNSLFQDFKPEPRRSSCMTSIDRRFSGAVRSKQEENTFDNNNTSLTLEGEETSPKSIHNHISPGPQIRDFTLRKTDFQPRLFFDKLLVNSGSQGEVRQQEDLDTPSPSFKMYTTGDLNQGKSASESIGKPVGFKYVDENKVLREKLREYEEKIRLLEKQVGNTNTKREF